MLNLKDFIATPTVAGDREHNQIVIDWLVTFLSNLGFKCSVEGKSPHHQPVVACRFDSPHSDQKIVLYNHYDVEVIRRPEDWRTPPFELTELDNRYFGRGLADNKAVLYTRLLAVQDLIKSNQPLPKILWIIQGEEEVAGQTPFEVIPKLFEDFGAKLYVEETGYQKKGKQLIFALPPMQTPAPFLQELNEKVFDGEAQFEFRPMRKFSDCPFLQNIPQDGYYIAFGPNDGKANIHQPNESIDQDLLKAHFHTFQKFLIWTTQADLPN